jgi:hypothetical protein
MKNASIRRSNQLLGISTSWKMKKNWSHEFDLMKNLILISWNLTSWPWVLWTSSTNLDTTCSFLPVLKSDSVMNWCERFHSLFWSFRFFRDWSPLLLGTTSWRCSSSWQSPSASSSTSTRLAPTSGTSWCRSDSCSRSSVSYLNQL